MKINPLFNTNAVCATFVLFWVQYFFSAYCYFRKMSRTYNTIADTHNYKSYSEDQLSNALGDIVESRLSIRDAKKLYKISFGTIYNKYKRRFGRKPRGQPVFSELEEKVLLNVAVKSSD